MSACLASVDVQKGFLLDRHTTECPKKSSSRCQKRPGPRESSFPGARFSACVQPRGRRPGQSHLHLCTLSQYVQRCLPKGRAEGRMKGLASSVR